ncbi:MMPL family transporter [Flammeovirgaceae bacterium SG7u.111]|nr:MMPL family transporter [Flammeovirgaceae bacterium SG7u.132]WPO34267.1 MMPL family transporter [Flammeovirgaceae bacterium SG7u.111]
MWTKLASFILKNRLVLIIALGVITAFMGFLAKDARLSYELMKIVPDDDPEMIYFKNFTETFGKDDNMFAIGIQDSSIYNLEKFNALYEFSETIKNHEGIVEVVSLPKLLYISKNKAEKRFEFKKLFPTAPKSQEELDSLLSIANKIKFYEGRLINPENGTTVILISMDDSYLNSKKRVGLVNEIIEEGTAFSEKTEIKLHYAGLPYVRTAVQATVKHELNMFLIISLGVTALILFLFFQSFSPVIFSLIVIGMVVIWTLGTLVIFDYEITMLTGLLPSILVVIGIPNCIYLLNKYHQEYILHGNKIKALARIIKKIGVVTLITNTTTAVGFFVLTFTGIDVLEQFGIIATVNIFNTFIISIIFIPAVFSYRPAPKSRHIRHLEFKFVGSILKTFDTIITKHRVTVYGFVTVLVVVAIVGMVRMRAVTYMVDDLPPNHPIRLDLSFFEENFNGIMPLEILVDTKKRQGVRKRSNLLKIDELEQKLAEIPEITPSVSVITLYKAANQAYFNNNPIDYEFPSKRNEPFIYRYMKNQQDADNDLMTSLVDTSGRYIRLSMKVADLGSIKMDTLVNQVLIPKIDSIMGDSELEAKITGTTLLFIKGNNYLIKNLRGSMLLAFVLIAAIMGSLFKSVRMIIISLIPNMIPLMITAALMGYFGIPLKPSTVLVFSIAFGISVDDSIHFLAKYRQELIAHKFDVPKAVSISLKETGTSMIYTSIVLFCGFVIFVASDFGGTISLGLLTSTTLLIAMLTNLILLPSLLLTFDMTSEKMKFNKAFQKYDFMEEDEDEEIDISLIEVKKNAGE